MLLPRPPAPPPPLLTPSHPEQSLCSLRFRSGWGSRLWQEEGRKCRLGLLRAERGSVKATESSASGERRKNEPYLPTYTESSSSDVPCGWSEPAALPPLLASLAQVPASGGWGWGPRRQRRPQLPGLRVRQGPEGRGQCLASAAETSLPRTVEVATGKI